MRYETIGNGEPLVLIHGLGQTHKAWDMQLELADQCRLFIPTLRGHGESKVTDNMTLEYFAADLLKMLDDNGITTAHFCGISLGGVVVQEILRQAPERVRSLILANTTSYVPCLPFDIAYRERIASLRRMNDAQYVDNVVNNALYMPTKRTQRKAKESFHLNRYTYEESAKAIRGINYLPDLNTNKLICIISSKEDSITPHMYNAQVTKFWTKRAELFVLSNAGHLSNIQRPAEFNRIVRDFVSA